MRAAQVAIGRTYAVKVSGRVVPVQLLQVSSYGGWIGRNVNTGRDVRVKTAGRLRYEVEARYIEPGSDRTRYFKVESC